MKLFLPSKRVLKLFSFFLISILVTSGGLYVLFFQVNSLYAQGDTFWNIERDGQDYLNFNFRESGTNQPVGLRLNKNGDAGTRILYDLDDGNYRVDPSSHSILNSLNINGRLYSNEWIQLINYTGLLSTLNSSHFYPNSGTYGSWRIAGSRSGWSGLEFDSASGLSLSLMMGATGQNAGNVETGVHRNGTGGGWLWRFSGSNLATVGNITSSGSIGATGSVSGAGGLYGPIFYDTDNTAYYASPHSGSRINYIDANDIYIRGALTTDGAPLFRNNITAQGAVVADYLSDRNNQAFYLDPHHISNVNALTAVSVNAAAINVPGNATWFYYPINGWNYIRGSTYAWNAVWQDENAPGTYYVDPSGSSRFQTLVYTGGGLQSDIRIKDNIQPLKNSLEKLKKLQGVSYFYKKGNETRLLGLPETRQIGLIAQEVEAIVPEVVHTADDGYKAIEYGKLSGLLIEALKEQQNQLDEEKKRNDQQQTEIEELKKQLAELKELTANLEK